MCCSRVRINKNMRKKEKLAFSALNDFTQWRHTSNDVIGVKSRLISHLALLFSCSGCLAFALFCCFIFWYISSISTISILQTGLKVQKLSLFFLIFFKTRFFLLILNEIDKVDGHASAVTGPSRKEGRNSPLTSAGKSSPTVGLHSSQQRWVPTIKLRQQNRDSSHDRNEIIFRTVRSILNKLTPENFQTLSVDLLNVGIASKVILKGIVILIFDKSIDEPRYSTLYANLCSRLYHEAPNFDPPPTQPINAPHGSTLRPNTFRRLLIAKLQDEFENRNRKLEAFDSKVGPLDADEEEQRLLSKHHMLGNIKFIGELYRLGILHENIMHKCIKQLINKKKKGTIADMAEDLECLSQIMTTCGKRLDHPKAKSLMDQYFERMEVLRRKHLDLPSRICFMLQDVVELRMNNWVPRRMHRNTGPKTLNQIRQEVLESRSDFHENNGERYREHLDMSPRFQSKTASFGTKSPRFQTSNIYPGANTYTENNDFPQAPKFTGGFPGTSPPAPTSSISNGKSGNTRGFDFFGPIQPRPAHPSGPASNSPSGRPSHQDHLTRFNPTQQNPPEYNGYQQAVPAMAPRPTQIGGFPTHDVTMPPPPRSEIDGARETGRPTGHKAEHIKPSKEIPPRFQKQKQQQKSEAIGKPHKGAEKDHQSMRNGGSMGPRKPPVFTPLNSNAESDVLPHQASPKTQMSKGTPLAVADQGLKRSKTQSPRSHPVDTTLAPQRHRGQSGNRYHSPTIQQKNVDAIQAPFQHAIDNATQKVVLTNKNSGSFQDKPKGKKTSLSKEDIERISDDILEKFFSKTKTEEQIGKYLLDLKVQNKHLPILLSKALISSLSKSDEEKERIGKLFSHIVEIKVCTKEHVLEGIQSTMEKLSDLESEIQLIKSSTASLVARLVTNDLVTLAEVADMLIGGIHFPLFLLTLQQMSKVKGQDWIGKVFKESKVDMIKMLPEASQTKSAMISILEGKQLEFLLPLVHIEFKLTNQIAENSNPASIYKWIKENVTSDLHCDPRFINVLVSCCLDHVTKSSSLGQDVDPIQNLPKEIKEKERHLLADIKKVLQKFVHDNKKLQLHALYAAQVFCCNKSFPKGLLLRLFNSMYEEDIIDEETFFVWKEDVTDSYPGKGKALFQVNAWLTWLHEAETEDEEGED